MPIRWDGSYPSRLASDGSPPIRSETDMKPLRVCAFGIALVAAVQCGEGTSSAAESRQEQPTGDFPPALNRTFDISPDGRHLAFAVMPPAGDVASLWLTSAVSGRPPRRLGRIADDGNGGVGGFMFRPRWSPNGRFLAYLAMAEGRFYLHVLDIENGRVSAFDRIAACAARCREYELQWTPDSRALFYIGESEEEHSTGLGDRSMLERRSLLLDDSEGNGITVRALSTVSDPEASVEEPRSAVVVANIAENRASVILSGAAFRQIYLAPDGTNLLAVASSGLDRTARQRHFDLLIFRLPETSQSGERGGDADLDVGAAQFTARIKAFEPCVAWSPDSSAVAFIEQGALSSGDAFIVRPGERSSLNLTSSLDLPPQPADAATGGSNSQERNFGYRGRFGGVCPVWDPNGRLLYLTREGRTGTELWVADIESPRMIDITPQGRFTVVGLPNRAGTAVMGSDRSGVVAAVRYQDGRRGFIDLRGNGQYRDVLRFRGNDTGGLRNLSIAGDGSIVFLNETRRSRQNLYLANLRDRVVRQLTDLAPNQGGDADWGSRLLVPWTTSGGTESYSILHFPPDRSRHRAVGPPPVIVQIYPGSVPITNMDVFPGRSDLYLPPLHDMLLDGYAVLVPYLPITPGGGACAETASNSLAALDAAIERGLVDGSRAGVMGHSFGGWGVNCIISHTNRFRAAVSSAGMSDLISRSFSSRLSQAISMSGAQTRINSSIWDHPELYTQESPVLRANRIETPLLLLHGKLDSTVPVDQSLEMFYALANLGKPVTIVTYDQHGHNSLQRDPDYLVRVKNWFGRYLNIGMGSSQAHLSFATPGRSAGGTINGN